MSNILPNLLLAIFVYTISCTTATAQSISVRPVSAEEFVDAVGDGRNVGLAVLGGQVSGYSPYRHQSVSHLNDGIIGEASNHFNESAGWHIPTTSLPQDVQFSFERGETFEISGFSIVTSDWYHASEIEVYMATNNGGQKWEKAEGLIKPKKSKSEQFFLFSTPIKTSALNLRLLKSGRPDYVMLSEVKIFGLPLGAATTQQVNLALPAFGGSIIEPVSGQSFASALVDGRIDTQFRSLPGQESATFTFGFRDYSVARISKLILLAGSGSSASVPRLFKVEISKNFSPLDEFEPKLLNRIPWSNGAAELSFPEPIEARYLRLTLFPQHGAPNFSIAEVQLVESQAEGYTSVASLNRNSDFGENLRSSANPERESQSDDDVDAARVLQPTDVLEGEIWPETDIDHVRFAPPGAGRGLVFNYEDLSGNKVDVQLLKADGKIRSLTGLSNVEVGVDDVARITSAANVYSVLLIDESGSMRGTQSQVHNAVNQYIDNRRSNEITAIYRFGLDVKKVADFQKNGEPLKAANGHDFAYSGGTALYQAVSKAQEVLANKNGAKVIVLLSDGANWVASNNDNQRNAPTSVHLRQLQKVWRNIGNGSPRIYVIGLGEGLDTYANKSGLASTAWQALQMFSAATGGLALRTPDATSLDTVYTKISSELRAASRYRLALSTKPNGPGRLVLSSPGYGDFDLEDHTVELIYDASGSMKESAGRQTKIVAARNVLRDVIGELPSEVNVGLRTFGHRIRETRPGDCEDIELIQPHGPLNRAQLIEQINSIKPLGTTPIYNAIRAAADDLKDQRGRKSIVLVTDGIEECLEPPTRLGAELKNLMLEEGLDLHLNIVGFALKDERTRSTLRDAATSTGGRFYDAEDSAALQQAILESFKVASFEVFDETGTLVASGKVGDDGVELQKGQYSVRIRTPLGFKEYRGISIQPATLRRLPVDLRPAVVSQP
ncbi:MAG: VWA domain-containing protein [Rhizobiaceae bacterium]|nr:VWA domain-containing protein [Hyphomicrobiales bacterium]NRB32083.1 VWA domain-containing protein [Rhizobiaceae bacterium]